MNRGKTNRNRIKRIHPFFLFAFLLILSIFPALTLIDWFFDMQISTFSTENRLMLVYGEHTIWIFIVVPAALAFSLAARFDGGKHKKVFSIDVYTLLAIAIVLIGLMLMCNNFYYYTNLDKSGIQTRRGIGSEESYFKWTDIERVLVSYRFTRKSSNHVNIDYELYLPNGQIVDLNDSVEFFPRILETDKFIRYQGIIIKRSGIDPDDYHLLKREFEGPGRYEGIDRWEIAKKILHDNSL